MPISDTDRRILLDLARQSVLAEVSGTRRPALPEAKGVLGEPRGCFVTLKNRGRLRGCIGTFHADDPLVQTVRQMGAHAAQDPRFVGDPVTPDEVPHLSVEVSVLSPLTPTDAPLSLEIGVHGIYIVGRSSGCFLPEVATEMNWTAEQFLSYCCASKAGLPSDAWKQPGTTVYLFTTEKFGDEGAA